MAEVQHFCPDCGAIDLVTQGEGVLDKEGRSTATATCPNCSWSGPLSDSLGAATTERFFNIDKVGEILLRVITKNAAGPLVQVLEYLGLLPRFVEYEGVKGAEEMIQQARDYTMRRILSSALETSMEASLEAQEQFRSWLEDHHPELAVEKYGQRKRGSAGAKEMDARRKKAKGQKASRRKNRDRSN